MPFGKRTSRAQRAASSSPASRERRETREALAVDEATLADITAWPDKHKSSEYDRRAAARLNIVLSLAARAVIIFAAIYFLAHGMLASGDINQWLAWGLFAMVGDYIRVLRKALRETAN